MELKLRRVVCTGLQQVGRKECQAIDEDDVSACTCVADRLSHPKRLFDGYPVLRSLSAMTFYLRVHLLIITGFSGSNKRYALGAFGDLLRVTALAAAHSAENQGNDRLPG